MFYEGFVIIEEPPEANLFERGYCQHVITLK